LAAVQGDGFGVKGHGNLLQVMLVQLGDDCN